MPSLTIDKTPRTLKPYEHLGLDISHWGHSDQVLAECPFCSADRKFSINVNTGLWRCFVCNAGSDDKSNNVVKGGNIVSFLRLLHKRSDEATINYDELMKSRGILQFETLALWGACRSIITDEWLLPGFDSKGHLIQLYRWVRHQVSKVGEGGRIERKWINSLMGIPGLEVAGEKERLGILGVFPLNDKHSDVYICEGPWDGMVLWEALGGAQTEPAVVAAPGCNSFFESWIPLFAGKRVHLLYDSDYPKINKQTGQVIGSPGHEGMRRVARMLTSHASGPSEVLYLDWSKTVG